MVRAFMTLKLAAVAAMVALFLGGAPAVRAGGPELAGTAWASPTKLDDGERGVLVMAFNDEGEFMLLVCNSDGEVLKKVQGTYKVRGDMLRLFVKGKEIAHEEIVSVSRASLVTEADSGKQTSWKRYAPKKTKTTADGE